MVWVWFGYELGCGSGYGIGYGLGYRLGYGLRYGLGYGLGYGLQYGLGLELGDKKSGGKKSYTRFDLLVKMAAYPLYSKSNQCHIII